MIQSTKSSTHKFEKHKKSHFNKHARQTGPDYVSLESFDYRSNKIKRKLPELLTLLMWIKNFKHFFFEHDITGLLHYLSLDEIQQFLTNYFKNLFKTFSSLRICSSSAVDIAGKCFFFKLEQSLLCFVVKICVFKGFRQHNTSGLT